jgi:hypothetical protein
MSFSIELKIRKLLESVIFYL